MVIPLFAGVNAQTPVQGYYVNMEDDTVEGFIDWRDDFNDGRDFSFSPLANSELHQLMPKDAKAYVIEGKKFFEKHVLPDEKGNSEPRFYRVILVGELDLLEYNGWYFGRDKTEMALLTPRRTQIDPSENKSDARVRDANAQMYGYFYSIDNSGLPWLKARMKKCPKMLKRLDTDYKMGKPAFRSIFKTYHKCIGAALNKPGQSGKK